MRIPPSFRPALACLAIALWLPLQSQAGIFDDNEARKAIVDLGIKLDKVAREIDARIDGKADKTAALSLVNQYEQTQQDVARLRGQIEVLANEVATAQQRQKDFYADLDARMRRLEPRQVTIDGAAATVDAGEQKAHDAGAALLKAGDYAGAAAALGEFVRRYPASPYAAGAQYGVGTAFYALHDYPKAIAAQELVVAAYKDSPQAPDALFNLIAMYTEMKDKKAAQKTLRELATAYPDSRAAASAAKPAN